MVEVLTTKIYNEINNNLLNKNNNLLYEPKYKKFKYDLSELKKFVIFKISFITYDNDIFSFTLKIGILEKYEDIFEKVKNS